MDTIAVSIGTPFVPTNVSLKYMEVISADVPLFMEDKITLDELVYKFDKVRGN